jgi:hypothetical protein
MNDVRSETDSLGKVGVPADNVSGESANDCGERKCKCAAAVR